MKLWVTEIIAKNPYTGELKKYCGPEVPGISMDDARNYCENNGLGYCRIIGELVAEIPCKKGTYDPDFENTIDYEQPLLN